MSEIQGKTKVVKFAGEQVTVRELTLGDFPKVGDILGKVVGRTAIIDAFKSDDTEKQAMAMAELLVVIPLDLAELINLATGVNPEVVLKATVSEVLDLFLEIWKLNNLVDVFGKKLAGVLGNRPAPPKVANPPSDPVTPQPPV